MILKFVLSIYVVLTVFIGVEGKKKMKNKFRATVFPLAPKGEKKTLKSIKSTETKKHVIKSNNVPKLSNPFNLLHKESLYNRGYLIEYKKMISSLLPGSSDYYSQFGNREFLPLPNEKKTIKSRYCDKMKKLTNCNDFIVKSEWKKLKVLQLEDSNSVTLKANTVTGEKVVEKAMDAQKHYQKELNFFRHAHHGSLRYFPKLICASKATGKNSKFSIVTDFVDGEKSHVMASVATWEQLRFMVAQFFNAVVELHKVGFIHCDLSPANVMVTKEFDVKLIDFGMSLPVGQARGYRGSVYARAPELHEMCPGKIDVSIDWWAFGVTVSIWYFYHYNPQLIAEKGGPSYHFTPMKLRKKLFTTNEFPPQFPEDLRKLLSLFLTIDPEFRTFGTLRLQNMIRSHEFFKGFNWCTAEKC